MNGHDHDLAKGESTTTDKLPADGGLVRRVAELEQEVLGLRRAAAAAEEGLVGMLAAFEASGTKTCLLDSRGRVVWSNEPWRSFVVGARAGDHWCAAGLECHAQCVVGPEASPSDSASFAAGLQRILGGEVHAFEIVFGKRCHTGHRWVRARLRAFGHGPDRRVVVCLDDVSDQQTTAEMLRGAGAARDQSAVEVFWIRRDGSIADASEQACRALGYTRQELQSLHVADLDSRHVHADWAAHWDDLRRTGALSFHSRQRCKDGSEREVAINVHMLRSGGEEWCCAFAVDLAEVRRATTALQESEARYRELFEAAPDAVFLIALGDDAGRIIDANGAAASMHGYTRDDLRGMHIGQLDIPEHAALVGERLLALTEHGAARFEVRHLRKDGTEFPVEVTASLANVHGRRCVVSFNRDITAHKLAKASLRDQQMRLELAAQAGNIGFWDWDITSGRTYYSPEWKAQLGYAPHEVADHYEEWRSRLHPEDAAFALSRLEAHLRSEATAYSVEIRMLHRDGGYRWIFARSRTIRDASGTAIRMVGCHVDVTMHKQAEEQRAAMARQVAQLHKLEAIGTLASGIAHDFNNILAVITGNLAFARALVPSDSQVAEHLTEISRASERATALVRQVLTFGRVQGSERKQVDPTQLLTEVAKFMRATISTAIAIEVHAGLRVPTMHADAAQLHQVLVNLCTNAWHAMEGSNGVLRLEVHAVRLGESEAAEPRDRHGPHVCISVSDTGVGMDSATQRRVFEPFFTTKATGKGTGLGLSVVHGIVSDHGGWVELTSEVGKGTRFQVFLPVRPRVEEVSEVVRTVCRGSGQRVLLLEDEPSLARLLTRSLEQLGYRVTPLLHPDGLEAAMQGAETPYDVVVTDYEMPGESGLDVARRVRRRWPDVPILLCSGFFRPELGPELDALGIRRVLAKPFSPADLTSAIHEVLGYSPAP